MDTIIPQITADVLGISPDLVDGRLGDTNYPEAPISAGSMSTASVGPPLSRPPLQARQKFILGARSPVHTAGLETAGLEEVEFEGGKIFLKSAPTKAERTPLCSGAAGINRGHNRPRETSNG